MRIQQVISYETDLKELVVVGLRGGGHGERVREGRDYNNGEYRNFWLCKTGDISYILMKRIKRDSG